ncbi:HAD family hydrolase [Paraglaciecola hydrolytica]|uniref:Phosphoglycolate phosphatase n=1 Tax=Paraglaciecola hydrolytica TaxID=1799789 RepID=A0A136A121_9ALTE|nr:HAD-IA family hydrolase [Paraglaciecola hydrolytica]KXI28931.1 phosphoglycolate phosphatase [Paraglaciecola hydrolytica]
MSGSFAGVLFDLDGTLLDTARDLGSALNSLLAQMQRPLIAYADYRKIASDGAKGMLELGFGDELKTLDFQNLHQKFLDYYATHICVDTCYFDGVEKLLTELNYKSIPWGIVTNKPGDLTTQLLTYFPLLAQCHVVVSGDTLAERKPHPLPLLYAAQKLNLEVNQLCYVGDALRDIQAAQAANITSVIAQYGYIEHLDQLSDWQADLHISQASDLLVYC